jgi:hypothetical protein
LPVDVPGALGHALQSLMPGAHFAREHGRLDADFVVANANSIRQVASGDTGPLVHPRQSETVDGYGREALDYAPVRSGGTNHSIVRSLLKKCARHEQARQDVRRAGSATSCHRIGRSISKLR